MCTFNLTLSDAAVDRIRTAFKDDAAIHEWLQKQLEMLVIQFQVTQPRKYDMSVFDRLSNDWDIEENEIREARHSEWSVEPW